MRHHGAWVGYAAVAAAVLAALAAAVRLRRPDLPAPAEPAAVPAAVAVPPRVPTLYCEFTNFADRTPLVGFYFRIEAAQPAPAYVLISRREQDGSEADAEGPDAPPARWTLDGAGEPAVIRAPDDTAINIYGYAPDGPGVAWFEAGLRSVRYRNLGGRCRRSA